MKTMFCFSVAAGLLLVGCGENSKKSPQPTNGAASGSSPLSAPADYVGALGKAQQTAVKTVDVTSLNQAIQLFNVDQGRNPKDLNELVEKKFYPKLPDAPRGMKLQYDATAGKVTVVKQ
jgi:ABC-type Fe3+-hydroxamate transport system substrate-binding protein